MNNKKVLMICTSIHHTNTLKIAKVIGEVLNAKIIKTTDVNIEILSDYDLIGFGSGIYNGKHHRSLLDLVSKLKTKNYKKVFIFSTATIPFEVMHRPLKECLIYKGFDIIGEFCCKGFMSHSFTKYIFGGLNKGRPNEKDLKKAQDFAKKLKEDIN